MSPSSANEASDSDPIDLGGPGGPVARLGELAERFEVVLGEFVEQMESKGVETLHEGSAYALGVDIADPAQRGKRLRPALCLLAAEALGGELDRADPFAVAIELMHNFCLVHDDIEDGDTVRRGRPSAWTRFGLPHAINIGDYLLVQSQRALADWGPAELNSETRFRLIKLLGATLDHTHIGQALDMNARGKAEFTEEQYLRTVREKTGHYLAAPIQGGAIVAGAEPEVLETIAELARWLGPLFQIADDMIDLTEGKGRGAKGSDIGEGKRSYMVAHAAERCGSAERERLFAILDKPREATTEEDVKSVMELFEKHGSLAAGRDYCAKLYDESLPVLDSLPPELAEALGAVFASLVGRRR